jgi:malate permease and related proteins
MINILVNTILPIFSIIFVGYLLKLKKVIDPAFSRTANQIVFNVAIPAMLLNELAQASFRENFNLRAVICTLAALVVVMLISLLFCTAMNVPRSRRGTFLHSSFHGNLGYMAYAIAYYTLGESHFARMAILSSFLMIGQNSLAVWALTTYSGMQPRQGQIRNLIKLMLQNPIILTMIVGITWSALGFAIPKPLQKGLDILSGMAFPTALLLIGSSLSFGAFRELATEILGIGFLKLIGLPLTGYALMMAAGVPDILTLPAMILLGSPPATVTYIMATELGGDPELAATSVSLFTLASAFSYTLILWMFS